MRRINRVAMHTVTAWTLILEVITPIRDELIHRLDQWIKR